MFLKVYLVKMSFLLSMVQLSLAVYLGIQQLTETQFYDRMFEYSIVLSLIPIIYAIFYAIYNGSTTYEDFSNGFVNKNSSILNKNIDASIYLFAIGFLFLIFDTFFRVFSLPIWTNAIIPLILLVVLITNNKRVNLKIEE